VKGHERAGKKKALFGGRARGGREIRKKTCSTERGSTTSGNALEEMYKGKQSIADEKTPKQIKGGKQGRGPRTRWLFCSDLRK